MTDRAPQPVTAAANPPVQPLASNLLPTDVVRISATRKPARCCSSQSDWI